MSDTPQGPGWWMASDEKWYPPEESPHKQTTTLTPDRFAPPSASEHPVPAPTEASNDTPVDGETSTPPKRRPGNRRMVVLVAVLGLILAGLVVALALTALGSDDSPEGTADVTTTSHPEDMRKAQDEEPVVDPALTFGDAASNRGTVLAVDTIDVNGNLVGFAALLEDNSGDGIISGPGSVRTWSWEADSWVEGEPISTEFQVDDWILADVTGDGVQDLLLEMVTGNGLAGAVLTAHSGQWSLPQFRIGEQEPSGYTDSPLRWGSSILKSDLNTCDPSCAEGRTVTHTWGYNADEHIFASEEP